MRLSDRHSSPACIKCDNCKPVGGRWACFYVYGKLPDFIDDVFCTHGFCNGFTYRSTKLDECIDKDEYTDEPLPDDKDVR